jgi:hypothetical protein
MMRKVKAPVKVRYDRDNDNLWGAYPYGDSTIIEETVTVPSIKSLIKRVCQSIKQHRNRFDMEYWHSQKREGCNTTHCAAGWVSVLFNPAYKANVRYAQRVRKQKLEEGQKVGSTGGLLGDFDPAEEFAMEVLTPDADSFTRLDAKEHLRDIFTTTTDKTGSRITPEQVATKLRKYGEIYG